MPIRLVPIVTGEYYHIFNRGINKAPTFTTDRDNIRAQTTLQYYLNSSLLHDLV